MESFTRVSIHTPFEYLHTFVQLFFHAAIISFKSVFCANTKLTN